MKLTVYGNIILLMTLLLLASPAEAEYTTSILPRTKESVYKIVQTPSINIQLQEDTTVFMNVSRINLQDNTTLVIDVNIEIINQIKYLLNQNGHYLFEFYTEVLNLITIRNSGINTSYLIIIAFGILIQVGTYIYDRKQIEF